MASRQKTPETNGEKSPKVFMMDLWATVPYYTAYLSRALQAEGVRVQVGSITYYLDRECFRSRGLRLDPGLLNIAGRLSLPKTLRRLLKMAEGLLNLAALTVRFSLRPPDIVHVQYLPLLRSRLPVDAWFVRFCQWRGTKIVLTVHDLLPHDTADRYKEVFAGLYHQVDALICHSDHIKHRLEQEFEITPEKIAVIPHGPFFFDLPETDSAIALQTLGVESGQQMVLWQGIIFPYKGLDLLLDAWQRVESQAPKVCLVVLGTGAPSLTAELEDQAKHLGLSRVRFRFRFCSVEELVAAYRAATIVVYPYRAITTSGALATGLALKKPIVASDLAVFREVLTDGDNAILIDPYNTGDLARAIVSLSEDSALRHRLAVAVDKMRFGPESWKVIAVETFDVYRAILRSATYLNNG
jgi:glycosyltransferase involved in cell wall biosynthesis